MKKRYLCVLLALVMVLGLFAGCDTGSKETEPSATIDGIINDTGVAGEKEWYGEEDGVTPVHLRFWGGIQEEYGYDTIVENFNKLYEDKGLTVEYVRYKNDTDGNLQLETQLMTGEGIDCFIGYGSMTKVLQRAEAGLISDWSGYLEEVGFDIAKELGTNAAVDAIQEDGSVYGLPTKFDNNGFMLINVDMFNEAGVEIPYDGWTYAEFLDAVEKLTTGEGADKVYGICWYSKTIANAQVYVRVVLDSYYYYTTDEMTESAFLDPVWENGLEMIKTTMDNGWACDYATCKSEEHDVTHFVNGHSAIFGLFSQLRVCMDVENYPHDFVTALVPCPVPDESYSEFMTMGNMSYSGDYACVAAKSPYQEQAAEFLRWYIMGGMNPLIEGARYPLWTGNDTQDILDCVRALGGDSVDLTSLEMLFNADRNGLTHGTLSNDLDSQIKTILKEAWEGYLLEDGAYTSAAEAMKAAYDQAQALIDGAN